MTRLLPVMLALLAAGSAIAAAAPPPAVPADLAAAFGARSDISSVRVSPDGNALLYLSALPGAGDAVIVVDLASGKSNVAMARDGKGVRPYGCNWAGNQRIVCSFAGSGLGDIKLVAFQRLIAFGRDGSKPLDLTPGTSPLAVSFSTGTGQIIDWLPDRPGQVLMSNYASAERTVGTRLADGEGGYRVVRVDTATGARVQVEPPRPDAVGHMTDGHGNVRLLYIRSRGAGGVEGAKTSFLYRPGRTEAWRAFGSADALDPLGLDPQAFDADGTHVYALDRHEGRHALFRLALDGSGRRELVFAHPRVDVDGVITVGAYGRVVGATYVDDKRYGKYFDPATSKLLDQLGRALPGSPLLDLVSESADGNRQVVFAGSDTDPGRYYLLDRTTHKLTLITEARPQLAGVALASVRPITYPAADGTPIPAYLTLPAGRDPKRLPAIVMPHGGPASRDEWGFDWLPQYFAARGYAVIQPNYRGSAGYGERWFQKNGFQSWRVAVGDINDAARYLARAGIADPARTAIVGWSYGGYAALQGAVLDPGLYKAVVAIAPVTDLGQLRGEEYDSEVELKYIGTGPHIAEGSPARHAGAIKVPVLLVHGTKDTTVLVQQSRTMKAALERARGQVEYLELDGLDHQLEDSGARARMLTRASALLDAATGGAGGETALAAAFLLAAASAWAAAPAYPKLDDLAARFGARPDIGSVALSPGGDALAIVTPIEDNRSVALVYEIASKRYTALVADRKSEFALGGCTWKSNTRLVCTLSAQGYWNGVLIGYDRVMAVDRDGGNMRALGRAVSGDDLGYDPGQSSGHVLSWLPDEPDWVLMEIPDQRRLGVARVNVRTGARRPVMTGHEAVLAYYADPAGHVLAMERAEADPAGKLKPHVRVLARPDAGAKWVEIGTHELGQPGGIDPVTLDADTRSLLVFAPKDGRKALFRVPLDRPAKPTLVFAHDKVDVDGVHTMGKYERPVGALYTTDYSQTGWFDPALERLSNALGRAVKSAPVISIVDESWDGRAKLVFAGGDTDPGTYALYDTQTHRLDFLPILVRPRLEGLTMAEQRPVTYSAADGTPIPGYLTLPPGKTSLRGLSAIVMPHGGPAARDRRGFNWLSQFFAQSGYAVLQPNYRGSAGYGEAFLAKNGFRGWRQAMGDINDGARWLIAEGADPARLGMFGWSYGGYAALQAQVVAPGLYKAAVAVAPVTDIPLLKTDAQDFTSSLLVANELGGGTEAALGSPARNADKIKVPVLIFHGDKDLNVGINQSRRMAGRLRAAGGKVELVVYPGLDHQLKDGGARADMLRRSAAFLRDRLGG